MRMIARRRDLFAAKTQSIILLRRLGKMMVVVAVVRLPICPAGIWIIMAWATITTTTTRCRCWAGRTRLTRRIGDCSGYCWQVVIVTTLYWARTANHNKRWLQRLQRLRRMGGMQMSRWVAIICDMCHRASYNARLLSRAQVKTINRSLRAIWTCSKIAWIGVKIIRWVLLKDKYYRERTSPLSTGSTHNSNTWTAWWKKEQFSRQAKTSGETRPEAVKIESSQLQLPNKV